MIPRWNGRRGFSLIEMLVIIVVIGILAAIAMQSMTSTVRNIRQVRTEREMDMLARAIVGDPALTRNHKRGDFGYVGDVGAFPPNLQSLYQNPGGYTTWNGPYLPTGYTQDSTGFKTDEWGALYSYAGGITITSTGSGSTMTKKIADAANDYLLNTIRGTIMDAANEPPGATYIDSVDIVITYPNGAGSTTNKTYNPDSAGIFTLDSIPVGTHLLRIIYTPGVDTLLRYLTVLPRHKSQPSYRFASVYFTSGPGGGCDSTGTLVLRPTGPGAVTQLNRSGCSANWECVAEAIADGNSSRVERLNGNYRTDTYATEDISSNSCNISKVTVFCRGQKSTIFITGYLRVVLRIGGTDYQSSAFALNNSWTTFSQEWLLNPSTGLPWTWDDINNLEAGVSLRSNSPWFTSKCTQVWIEVEYTP